jgi:hypothetical protein
VAFPLFHPGFSFLFSVFVDLVTGMRAEFSPWMDAHLVNQRSAMP